jgi:hypothetical protein
MNLTNEYYILLIALIFGVAQATLDKQGVGRFEHMNNSVASSIVIVLGIPLNLLSNMGLIIISIWSFFVLEWLYVSAIVTIGFVIWSFVLTRLIFSREQSNKYEKLMLVGVPLQFINKTITSACVLFLAWSFL